MGGVNSGRLSGKGPFGTSENPNASCVTTLGSRSSRSSHVQNAHMQGSSQVAPTTLLHFPSGKIGKLLIRKSGRVQIKIGDSLFDVDYSRSKSQQEFMTVLPYQDETVFLGKMEDMFTVRPKI